MSVIATLQELEARGEAQPASSADGPLAAFVAGTSAALGEWAHTEVVVSGAWRTAQRPRLGDLTAVLELRSATIGPLVLSFPEATALALARRAVAEAADELDEALMRDCLGESANVIAGQAKALLLGTPDHFALSTPRVTAEGEGPAAEVGGWLIAAFESDAGAFALGLGLRAASS
jgi:CheY-specific phosphatase CheX